ncbi:MAG: hypothetical protein Q9172_001746 [Xanthocarpia lactea]
MAQDKAKDRTDGNAYTSKNSEDDESHQMISSLFLGPHAENYEYFKSNIITILEATRDARLNYFPEDGPFISEQVQTSATFGKHTDKVGKAVKKAAELLSKQPVVVTSLCRAHVHGHEHAIITGLFYDNALQPEQCLHRS